MKNQTNHDRKINNQKEKNNKSVVEYRKDDIIKGYVKEVKLTEKGFRELKIELLSEEEPDWRELIKKQVKIKVIE